MKKTMIMAVMMVLLMHSVSAIGILTLAQDNVNVETSTIFVVQGSSRNFIMGVQNGANETYVVILDIGGIPTFTSNGQKSINFTINPYEYEKRVNLTIPLTGAAYNFSVTMRGTNNDDNGQIGTMPGVVESYNVREYIPCSPNWQCGTWNACYAGSQTRTCNDLNSCGNNTGKPATQQTCTCNTNWQCSAWGVCTNSSQNRTCTDANNCGITTGKPALNQSCTSTCTPSWTCGSWSGCSANSQSRNCTDSNHCNVTTGRPAITQSCTSCTPSWTCGAWGTCTSSSQSRTCTDSSNCNVTTNRPALTQSCTSGTTGGTGGGTACLPSWTCTSWSSCINGKQNRTCGDTRNCNVTTGKPALNQSCSTNNTPINTTPGGTTVPPVPVPPTPITTPTPVTTTPPATNPPLTGNPQPTTPPAVNQNNTNTTSSSMGGTVMWGGIGLLILIIAIVAGIFIYRKNNQPMDLGDTQPVVIPSQEQPKS